MIKNNDIYSRLLWTISLLYLFLPIMLFLFFWCNFLVLVIGNIIIVFTIVMILKERFKENTYRKRNWSYFFIVLAIIFVWIYFSGIGGFSFQNADYYVRNPMYRDICQMTWPIKYDLSTQSESVQQICGSDVVYFVYYLGFWLPPAAISKALQLSEVGANIVLLIWAFLGVSLIFNHIREYLRKDSYIALIVFVIFSGLDIVAAGPIEFMRGNLDSTTHIEYWSGIFQYSSNTTLLYWVFNQAIPVWLIVALLLNMKSNKYTAAITSVIFAYSPFATIGMIPLAVYSVFKNGKFRKAFNVPNIAIPILMLVVYGSYYTMNSNNMQEVGFIFEFYSISKVLSRYAVFIVLEVLVFLILLRKIIKKYDYLLIAAIELMVIPLYHMTGWNDFVMRGSIPALFIICISCIKYLLDNWKKKNAVIISIIIIIGSVTPLLEINRSVSNTITNNFEPVETVYSFNNFACEDEETISGCNEQFFAHNYQDTIFYKYIGGH